jgi:hypothetical protein
LAALLRTGRQNSCYVAFSFSYGIDVQIAQKRGCNKEAARP